MYGEKMPIDKLQFNGGRLTRKTFDGSNGSSISNPTTILEGYAIVYNDLSSDRGGYKVRFAKDSAIPEPEVHALYNHDDASIIGNTANGTLRLFPDDKGVRVEIDLPNTSVGRDVGELVNKQYVNGMSFGLVEGKSTTLKENGQTIVEYSTFTFDEVTVTSIPAFVETSIEVKAPEETQPTELDQTKLNKLNPKANELLALERIELSALVI